MGDSAAIVERGVQHRAPFGRDGSRYRSKMTGLLPFDVRPVIERSWRCNLRMVEDGMRTTDLAPTRLPDRLRETPHLLFVARHARRAGALPPAEEIGRAACRAGGCAGVRLSVGAVEFKKKRHHSHRPET